MRIKLKKETKWFIGAVVLVAMLLGWLCFYTYNTPSYFVGKVNEVWINPTGEITAVNITICRNGPDNEATFNRYLTKEEFNPNGYNEQILNRNTLLIECVGKEYTVIGVDDKEFEILKEAKP